MKRKKKMKEKKGQVVMEFLMTYGWAILVIIIAIGVLAYFGVFSPDATEMQQEEIECVEYIFNDVSIRPQNSIYIEDVIDYDIVNQKLFYDDSDTMEMCELLRDKLLKQAKEEVKIESDCKVIITSARFYHDPDLICDYDVRCYKDDISYSIGKRSITFSDFRYEDNENTKYNSSLVFYDKETQRLYNNNKYYNVVVLYNIKNKECN